jgi:hypothetical protein
MFCPPSKWIETIYWHYSPFEKKNSTLLNPIVASLIEVKDLNTFSLTTIDVTNVTMDEFGVNA